jgi:hypothetical protein
MSGGTPVLAVAAASIFDPPVRRTIHHVRKSVIVPAKLLSSGLIVIFAGLGLAGVADADAALERSTWSSSFSAASIHIPDTRLDGGGRTELTSYHLHGGAERRFESSLALAVGANYDSYRQRFSGEEGLAALRPWSEIHQFGFNGQMTRRSPRGWSYGFGPVVGWSSESGNLDPAALSYGVGMAVVAGFSQEHRFGIGARIVRGIDRSIGIHPILILDWGLNESWILRNPRDASFAAPAGLELVYRKKRDWQFALTTIYHSSEFRLDESRVAPGGIGESSAILSFIRVTRRWTPNLNANAYLGVVLDGELRVEDAAGRRIAAENSDPAPMLGLSVRGAF